jgi:hypothetical protein
MKTEQEETAEEFFKSNYGRKEYGNGDLCAIELRERVLCLEARDRAKLLEGMRMMRDKIATLCQMGAMREANDQAKLTLECVARMSFLLDPAAVLAEMEGKKP